MKTYKKMIEKPKLVIGYDDSAENPRNWDNLSILIIRNGLGDTDIHLNKELERTQYESNNAEEHKELMTKVIEEHYGSKVLYSDFVSKYEHSGVRYFLGKSSGWDYSNVGFVFVIQDFLEMHNDSEEKIEDIVKAEIELFSKWANGNVYQFILYNNEGGVQDSLGGLYDLEEIREHLPDEWQEEDLQQYINYN